MANVGQAVLSVAGAVAGFVIGGPAGALKGFYLGYTAGQVVFPTDLGTVKGPRLEDLRVMSSTLGQPIPQVYGTFSVAGNVIWSSGLIETVHKEEVGGKGGPSQTQKTYSYSVDVAVGLCAGPIQGIRRIWADAICIYDVSRISGVDWDQLMDNAEGAFERTVLDALYAQFAVSEQTAKIMTVYLGDESQEPDPVIESYEGVGEVPAYRGLSYVVFEGLQLEKYGNRIPNLRFEVYVGTSELVTITKYSNAVIYPWDFSQQDPRDPRNQYIYTSAGGGGTPSSTLDGYIAANLPGYSDHVFGYKYYTNFDDPTYPFEGTPPGGADPVGLSVSINCIVPDVIIQSNLAAPSAGPADTCFWWTGGGPATHMAGGLWIHSTTQLVPTAASHCCGTYDAGFAPGNPNPPWSFYHYDRLVLAARQLAAPLDTEDDPRYAPLPGADGFFIEKATGHYVLGVHWVYEAATYHVMQAYAVDGSGNVTAYPRNPALPSTHVLYNNEAFWVANYNAAVAAGDMPAGLVYGVDYPETQGFGYKGEFDTDLLTTECVVVADIVQDICEQAGLSAGQVDATDLLTCIEGYAVTTPMMARDAIEPLRTVALFDAVENGAVLEFVSRGHAAVATLDPEELAAHVADSERPSAMEVVRKQEKELPKTLRLHYVSAERDYEQNQQYETRLTTEAIGESDIQVAVSITDERAAQLAQILLYSTWVGRSTYTFSLPHSRIALLPTDPILIPVDGELIRARLTGSTYTLGGLLQYEAVRDDDFVYTSDATPAVPPGGAGTMDTPICPHEAIFLDLPRLREEDIDAGYYAAVRPLCLDGRTCAVIYRSSDGGETYGQVAVTDAAATMGEIVGNVAPPDSGGQVITGSPLIFDETTVITVTLQSGDALESTTPAGMQAGHNSAAIGADGRWELIAYRDATLVSGSEDTWELTGLWRGLRDTEAHSATTVDGDRFVRLDAPGIVRINEVPTAIGVSKLLKTVPCNATLDETDAVSFTTLGLSYRPNELGSNNDVDVEDAQPGDVLTYNPDTGMWEAHPVPTGGTGGLSFIQADQYVPDEMPFVYGGTASVSGGQSALQFKDEGSNLGSAGAVTAVDFTGSGVTASHSSGTVTVNIPGGSGGGLVLLSAQTATTASQLDFTSIFSSTYDTYKIIGHGITFGTSNAHLYLEIGTGGGPSYDTGNNYEWAFYGSDTAGTAGGYSGSTGIARLLDSTGNTAGWDGCFELLAAGLLSTSLRKSFFGTVRYISVTPRSRFYQGGIQWVTTGTAVSALRFIPSTGTFSGTIRIYGIVNS